VYVGTYRALLSGSKLDPSTMALVSRMNPQPSAARIQLMNSLVVTLKRTGVWPKLEGLWVCAAQAAQNAQLNWIGASFTLIPRNSPTFTADRGYAGDGSSSYLDTGWSPSSSAIATQNSTAVGVWINAGTDTGVTSVAFGCLVATIGVFVQPRKATDRVGGRINSSTSIDSDLAVTTRRGFTSLTRVNASGWVAYRASSASSQTSSTSNTPPAGSAYVGALNDNGAADNFVDNRFAAITAGSGLSSTDEGNLYSALNTFLTAIGAN